MLCQSGLSGRAYILPSPIVLSVFVSEWTIRPSIHFTFANSVVWCCVRVDYQAEHTFYLRQECCLELCQCGLSERAYILPSRIVLSGVVSEWTIRPNIHQSNIVVSHRAEWTIRPSIHSTFNNSFVWCCVRPGRSDKYISFTTDTIAERIL